MKIRQNYVTNSSSSSFIVMKKGLTNNQIKAIRNHAKLAEKLNLNYFQDDEWEIEESDIAIAGFTWMDNFDIGELLDIIGVTDVEWGEYPFNVDCPKCGYNTRPDAIGSVDWESLLEEIE